MPVRAFAFARGGRQPVRSRPAPRTAKSSRTPPTASHAPLVLARHPHRPLPHFRGILRRRLHRSVLSITGASGESGANQSDSAAQIGRTVCRRPPRQLATGAPAAKVQRAWNVAAPGIALSRTVTGAFSVTLGEWRRCLTSAQHGKYLYQPSALVNYSRTQKSIFI